MAAKHGGGRYSRRHVYPPSRNLLRLCGMSRAATLMNGRYQTAIRFTAFGFATGNPLALA